MRLMTPMSQLALIWALAPGSTTFVTMHGCAHTTVTRWLCPHKFVPRHVYDHIRLCPDTFMTTYVCAQTRLCPDTIVPIHDCAQTWLCPDTFEPIRWCPYMTVPRHVNFQSQVCFFFFLINMRYQSEKSTDRGNKSGYAIYCFPIFLYTNKQTYVSVLKLKDEYKQEIGMLWTLCACLVMY